MTAVLVRDGKCRVIGERLFRVAMSVFICALIPFSGACRGTEELPQHVLDARKPNVTASRYISPPRSSDDRSATLLLFVHGVFGDTLGSWTRPNARSLPELILQRPEFASGFDAFAFGFASSNIKPGSFRIPEAAAALAREVDFREFLSRYERVVIVAHSMGGLVTLEMLTTFPKIRAKVPLVVTYGAPYDGAQVARLGELLNNPVVNDMLPRDDGNTFLLSLANRWREARNAPTTRVICAYETVPLPIVGLIVPSASSSSLCDGATTAIAEDHIGLVKPDSPEHESVKVLTNAIRTLAVAASKSPVVRGREQVQEPEPIAAKPSKTAPSVLRYTFIADAPWGGSSWTLDGVPIGTLDASKTLAVASGSHTLIGTLRGYPDCVYHFMSQKEQDSQIVRCE